MGEICVFFSVLGLLLGLDLPRLRAVLPQMSDPEKGWGPGAAAVCILDQYPGGLARLLLESEPWNKHTHTYTRKRKDRGTLPRPVPDISMDMDRE